MRVAVLQELTEAPTVAYREVLLPLAAFAAAALVVYAVGRFALEPAANRVVSRRNPNNPTIQSAVRRYLRLVVVFLAVAVGVVAAGFGHVLTGSTLVIAAATLAIGVAGQELIGALISGLFLVASPDIGVGDWIAWDDREGVVEAISFRATRVRTPNNETVTVPNTELTTNTLVTPYGREEYRVDERVGIGYDDDVDAAMAALRAAATDTAGVLADPEPRVYLVEFGPDAVRLRLQYWIRNPTRRDVLRVRSEVARAVKSRLDARDITLSPPPARDLRGGVDVSVAES
jgi:small-conductance mechanosensitive channel